MLARFWRSAAGGSAASLAAWISAHRGPASRRANGSSSTHGGWSYERWAPRATATPTAVALAFAGSMSVKSATMKARMGFRTCPGRPAPPSSPAGACPAKRPRPSSRARDLALIRPARRDKKAPGTDWLRQRVEAIIWTLKNQLGLERHGGRVLAGLWARTIQRLLALNACIWHNRMI